MKTGLVIGIVLALIAVGLGASVVGTRNDLVVQREAINGAFSQVEVALQRRADLIPNLVNTVKGFAAQEKDVIASVSNARAALGGARTTAEKIQANSQLDSALSRLLVVVESYPQLKSDANFMRLQDELAGTENRIAVERRKYNEVVQKYNVEIAKFPANISAMLFGFERNNEYFKTEEGARQAPKVDFEKK